MNLAKRAIEEFGACQKEQELAWLIDYLADVKLERVLEIGTQDGGTRWLWQQLAESDGMILSIDLDATWVHDAHFGDPCLHLIGDSHDPAALAWVHEILGDRPLDLLFIDGDHSLDGARCDFAMYSPLVRSGGVIALHDIVQHEHPESSEVDRLWAEIMVDHREALAFVDDRWQDTWRGEMPPMSGGIGVIRK
jgi:predicted O-methyltransferase YrrM